MLNIKTFFDGSIKLINMKLFKDSRGYFTESYNYNFFKKNFKLSDRFVQDNISFSRKKNTIRGMHLQLPPFSQSKLVSVLSGSILDYFVDMRKSSKTFGLYGYVHLNSKKNQYLYVKKGFAHGFKTLEDNTTVFYKVSNYYSKKHEITLNFKDKKINIDWQLNNSKPNLSKKDLNADNFDKIIKSL